MSTRALGRKLVLRRVCSVYFKEDKPRYHRGHGTGLAFACMAIVYVPPSPPSSFADLLDSLSIVMTFNLQYENARRDKLFGTTHSFHEETEDAEDTLQNEKNQEQIRVWGLEGKTKEEVEALGDRVSASLLAVFARCY